MKNNKMIILENDNILLRVDIEFGGKIIELINKSTNYNWVWFESEKRNIFKPSKYSDYDSQWIGGYEELFPNDKLQNLNGKTAPDHGELWSSSWEVIDSTEDFLKIECDGYFSGAKITKTIELINNRVRSTYLIKNIILEKYLFKLHLAMPINKTEINFKFDNYQKVDKEFGNIISNNDLSNFLNNVNENESKNDFAYFYGNDGLVNVTNGKNKIAIKYDKESLPYLWIFQTRGGWNNLNVNVIEPCNSGLKDIIEADDRDLLYIPRNYSFSTWYEIEVHEN